MDKQHTIDPQDTQSIRPVLAGDGLSTMTRGESSVMPPLAAEPFSDEPTTVIEPLPAWRLVDVGELWRYRELFFFLTWRDVKVRYKQTVLGALWAIFQPLVTVVVFTIFFGKVAGLAKLTEHPYAIFAFAALLPWHFFAQSVNRSGLSLIGGANLITKVYFPRLIIPFASVGALLVDFAISFGVMVMLMFYYSVPPTMNLLMLPLLVFGTILAALGVGTFLSALAVAYRDVRNVIPFLIRLGLIVSPVLYPLRLIQENWQFKWQFVYALNPMVGIISGFRSALLGEPFRWDAIGISFLISLILFVIGALYFRRIERRFADIV